MKIVFLILESIFFFFVVKTLFELVVDSDVFIVVDFFR